MEAPFTPEKIERFLEAEALPFELVPLGVVGDLKAEVERLREEVQTAFDKGYCAAGGTITPLLIDPSSATLRDANPVAPEGGSTGAEKM